LLTVTDITKSYGPDLVLNRVSFALNRSQRVGLVGANGVGKSTLLKIIAGIEPEDSGTVSLVPQTITGFLPQTIPDLTGRTIEELIQESVGQFSQLESKMRRLEKVMASSDGDELARTVQEYGEISEIFEARGGYDIGSRIERVLEGLDIGYLERTRPADSLSGGEQTRVGLAALLLKSPDLLVLDEPTNNLDWKSLGWLEKYLADYNGAVIAASHDREFLNNFATDIFEIDEFTHALKKYAGHYDSYKLAKEADRQKKEEEYRQQQEEIKKLRRLMKTTARATGHRKTPRDGDKFISHFKGERIQKTASHVINTAEKRLERIEKNPLKKPPRPLRFRAGFHPQSIRSSEVIRAKGITKCFGEKPVLDDISFTLSHDARVVIIGPNGSGKTTLIRILAGIEKPDKGEVLLAPNTRTGYLPQECGIMADDTRLLEYYSRGRAGNRSTFMSELLLAGIFREEDINKKIEELSLGQARRLELTRMIAMEPNTLILDEPTNYISLDVMEAMENAIASFRGPVLAVSHDRRFIEKIGGEIWELKGGKLKYGGTAG
jgi:macrolide transport system ATP-binding/permease protein